MRQQPPSNHPNPATKIKLARVVGQPSRTIWSQVFSLSNSSVSGLLNHSTKPIIFGVLCVHSQEEGSDEAGSQIINFLQHQWQSSSLEFTDRAYQLLQQLKKHQTESLIIDILLIIIQDNTLILAGQGNVQVLLQRNQQLALIFKGSSTITVNQGNWHPQDQLIAGTNDLISNMSSALLQETLSAQSLDELEEEIAVAIRSDEHSEKVAALIIKFDHGSTTSPDQPYSLTKSNPLNRILSKLQPHPPSVYLRRQQKPKKVALSVGLMILFMLTISLIFGWRQRQKQLWQDKFQTAYDAASQYVQAADTLKQQNPLESRRLLSQAQLSLDQSLPELAEKPELQAKLAEYRQQIQQQFMIASGQKILENLQPWYEISLIKNNLFGTHLAINADTLLVLDKNQGLVAGVGLDNKQGALVGGGSELQGSQYIDTTGDQAVLLTASGLVELSTRKKTTAILTAIDSDWKSIKSLANFGSNSYLLDVGSSQIWKYPRVSGGVSNKQAWLNPGTNYNLTSAVDMVIDGHIWILDSSGVVWKFEQGGRREFNLLELEEPLQSPQAISLNENSDLMVILDQNNNRLVTFDKSGQYQQQYIWEGFKTVSDIVLYPDGKSVYALTGASIYKIDL